jgi:dGTPase
MHNPLPVKDYRKRVVAKAFDIRGDYFRDQTAIIHSMAYRRLKHKTQVFFSPENDHVCTRIEHVQHVATIASAICKGLNLKGWELDTEMAYAIGLGHDLGHAPFGHAGESALAKSLEMPFVHEVNSYRVAQKLADYGKGLNLTYGVADGIISHNGESLEKEIKPYAKVKNLDVIKDKKHRPSSYEGCIVRFADRVAYLGRDLEDALLGGLIEYTDIPKRVRTALGKKNGEIINTLVLDIINSSSDTDLIRFSDQKYQLLSELMRFNYANIYKHPTLLNYITYASRIVTELCDYLRKIYRKYGMEYKQYEKEVSRLGKNFGSYLKRMQGFYSKQKGNLTTLIVMDYVSGMTDDYALRCMEDLLIPKPIPF